jgi:AcrR family transcriptional regulator
VAFETGLRDRKKAETRASIAAVARRLIAANGYAETSVEAICREAGVSVPTFFRYYPTKADVLFEGADAVVDEWRHALVRGPAKETLGAALRRATHEIAFVTPERGSLAQLRAELVGTDPELQRKVLEIDARLMVRIAGALGELLDVDAADDPRAYLLAACAMGAVRSAQHVVGASRGKRALARRIDEAFDALDDLGALLRRPVSAPSARPSAGGSSSRSKRAQGQ